MGRPQDVAPVALADDRAEHALRDLLDAARRTDAHLSHAALVLTAASASSGAGCSSTSQSMGSVRSTRRCSGELRGCAVVAAGALAATAAAEFRRRGVSSSRGAGTARCWSGRSTLTTPPAPRTATGFWG
jgi:hypothetical protein